MAPRCFPSVTPLQLAGRRTNRRARSSGRPSEGLLERRLAMIGVHVANTTFVTTSTNSLLFTSSLPATTNISNSRERQERSQTTPSSSTLEISTLAAGGSAASTSLFSTPASTGTVAGTHAPTSAALAAASHNVSTSSASSATATQTPVTEFPWAAGDEALFLLLLNGSGGVPEAAALGSANVTVGPRLCSEWTAAQHTLFQTANLFFAVAFLVPRSFSQSILLVRTALAVGFCLSAFWAALTLCSADAVAWSTTLGLVNAAHAVRLAVRFLPPRLSPDLLDLYDRVFGPLKVDKQHFKELTREGRLLLLEPGDTYALEDVSPADDRLAMLLSGKLRVTCDQTYLHSITPQQFVDSPEWEAARTGPNHIFQVTITAEESSVCIYWSKPRLEALFRLRPLLEIIIITLIGKDITHKLYSMNEHLLSTAGALMEKAARQEAQEAARQEQAARWGLNSGGSETALLHRSLSVDAVHTGSRGHVRSVAWRTRQQRRASMLSDPSPPVLRPAAGVTVFPLHHQASPVRRVTQFPANSPFTHQFRRRPTPSWARPPPLLLADTCFSYSPTALQGSSRGPSYFTYPQQPLAASGLLLEPPPVGITPSPIMAAMAATVGGLLRLPPHAPSLLAPPEPSQEASPPPRKEVTFEENAV